MSDAAAPIDRLKFGDGHILHLASNLAVILGRFIIVVVLVLLLEIFTIIIGLVIVTIAQATSLTIALPHIAMVPLLTISEHDNETLELSIFLNRLQKLFIKINLISDFFQEVTYVAQSCFKFGENILLQEFLSGDLVKGGTGRLWYQIF